MASSSGRAAGTAGRDDVDHAVMITDMSGSYIKAGSNYSATSHQPVVLCARVLPRLRVGPPQCRAGNGRVRTLLQHRAARELEWSLPGLVHRRLLVHRANTARRTPRTTSSTSTTRTVSRGGSAWTTAGTARRKRRPTSTRSAAFFSGEPRRDGIGRIFDIYSPNGTETPAPRSTRRRSSAPPPRARWPTSHSASCNGRLPAGARPAESRRDWRSPGGVDERQERVLVLQRHRRPADAADDVRQLHRHWYAAAIGRRAAACPRAARLRSSLRLQVQRRRTRRRAGMRAQGGLSADPEDLISDFESDNSLAPRSMAARAAGTPTATPRRVRDQHAASTSTYG